MARKPLDVGDLQYFLALVRNNRLAAAGERLGADHTTVRRRIRALEAVFGERLFDKTSHGWQLTPAGERLLPHAKAIETETAAALATVSGTEPQARGTVRLLTTDGFGVTIVAPAMARLHAVHPEIQVELVTASRLIHHGVGDFDVAITLNQPAMPGLSSSRLAVYALRLYASPGYLKRAGGPASPAELRSHDLVWYVPSLLDLPELRTAEEVVAAGKVVFRSSNVNAQMEAVAAGLGIGLLPCFMAEGDSRLVPVLPNDIEVRRTYWIVLPPTNLQPDTVQVVCAYLSRVVLQERSRLLPPAGPRA